MIGLWKGGQVFVCLRRRQYKNIYLLLNSFDSMMWKSFGIILLVSVSLTLCKKQESMCYEPSNGVAAYPCESRPSREPLSLQYSKAQSLLLNEFVRLKKTRNQF